jgi:uncharacterized membrane protein YfcA
VGRKTLEEFIKITVLPSGLTHPEFFALAIVVFLTSVVSVITGSTSLIMVPAMLLFGIEPKSVVATYMLALVLMSTGGTLSILVPGVS